VKVGVTLPQFRPSVEPAIEAARVAEEAGLDGVFVFDHVWAIGHPERPAHNVWPMLGALSAETEQVTLGSLVARVSLLANAVLAHNFESLHRMVGDRLVAGLGTGDRLSIAENQALGVAFEPLEARLADLADACRRVRSIGVTTWVGGTSPAVRAVAHAEADALNLWGVDPAEVAAEVATGIEVTWGGIGPASPAETADLLRRLDDAGATWAVVGPPYGEAPRPAVEMVAEAMARLR
jgi:alkanesulfonate monooxygenase SsuD/methylene tetrahydromethanopterin reductase-like flavin-dependent oxidoreductase (luciferase family)